MIIMIIHCVHHVVNVIMFRLLDTDDETKCRTDEKKLGPKRPLITVLAECPNERKIFVGKRPALIG